MTGAVEWAVVYLIAGVVVVGVGAAVTLIGVAWNMRGVVARLEEKIMVTAQIVTDKIADSRHFLRDEFQAHMSRLETDFNTGLSKLDNEMTSVAAKLDMHRAEDAQHFQQIGERLASIEGMRRPH